jgi:hypothetical protein
MRVRVGKAFTYALDGNTVQTALPGEVHEGRVAQWALDIGDGVEVREETSPAPALPPPGEKDAGAAPANKALKPPKNKGAG